MTHSIPEYSAPTLPNPFPLLYMLFPVCTKYCLVLCIVETSGRGGGGGGKSLKRPAPGSWDRTLELDALCVLADAAAVAGAGAAGVAFTASATIGFPWESSAPGLAPACFLALSASIRCAFLMAIVSRIGSSIANDALISAKNAPRPKPRTPDMTDLVTHDSIAARV